MLQLSIIIVNYNGKKWLDACMAAIRKNIKVSYEVVLVDNASQDSSCAYIEENFPWIKLIASKENLGFAKGNNLAASHASGKYLLLLNNDTELLTSMVEPIKYMDDHPNTGILSIRMHGLDNEYRASHGHFPNFKRLLRFTSLYPYLHQAPQKEEAMEADWVEGSFMLIPKKTWDEVEGMDSTYFMYAEDMDLCYRIKASGRKIYYWPKYLYKHFGGYNPSRLEWLLGGYYKFLKKNYKGWNKTAAILGLRLNILFKTIKHTFKVPLGKSNMKTVGGLVKMLFKS